MYTNLITEFRNAMKADGFKVRETGNAYIAEASKDAFGHTHRIILNKPDFTIRDGLYEEGNVSNLSVEFYKDEIKVFEDRNLNNFSRVYEYVDFEFDYFGK